MAWHIAVGVRVKKERNGPISLTGEGCAYSPCSYRKKKPPVARQVAGEELASKLVSE